MHEVCIKKNGNVGKKMCTKYKRSSIIVEIKSIRNNAWKNCALKTRATR
jgi:hypothetical protein